MDKSHQASSELAHPPPLSITGPANLPTVSIGSFAMFVASASAASLASASASAAPSARPSRVAPRVRGVGLPRADACRARLRVRRRAADADPDADSAAGVPEDPQAAVEAMVDVDAIKAMISSDPAVRAQEAKIASSARDAASLRVDAQMAEEETKIAREFGGKQGEITGALGAAQEAALADLEAKSAAVLAAEAKMEAIAAERAALVAEAESSGDASPSAALPSKWGSTVASDVDEDAERVESAKAGAVAAAAGTLLSLPLLLSQSSDAVVAAESVAGVLVSCLVFGVTYRYALRDDFGNDQLKGGVVGAFGLARGLGAADVYLHGSDAARFETWAEAALLAGEGVLVFAFAAAALEAGFRGGFLRAFPMQKNER